MKIFNIKNIFALCSFTLALSACDLEVVPPSEIGGDNFWKTEKDAWYGLNACYANMPSNGLQDEISTDNGHSHKPWEGPFELIQQDGISSSVDRGYYYGNIRVANLFIQKVDGCALKNELKIRMKAEARFFRALEYLTLTSKFGKVPLVTDVPLYNAPNVPRDSEDKVREFILSELKEITQLLPDKYDGGYMNEKGRITKSAALALTARAALYFGDFRTAEEASGRIITEGHHSLFRISTLNDAQKKEADEMDQYIDFAKLGVDKDKFVKGMFSYECLWHKEYANPSNPEYILTRQFMEDDNNYDWQRYIYIRPSQLVKGYSSYEPMQDLVDAYWDVDGRTRRPAISMETRKNNFQQINADVATLDQKAYIAKVPTMNLNSYDYMKEFKNRDSRLYVSILFPFKGWHESDFGTFYYRWNPQKVAVDGNESWSGYSYRKMVALTSYQDWANIEDYPVIRYAEVLLTFAEARVQNTGWDAQVQSALNDLRDRCGMPNVPTSMANKAEALEFVRNERRIELAGEGNRYYDIRRYGNDYCATVMNGPSYAPNGYKVVEKKWSNRLQLMPIPQSAIDLNPLLKADQNPGY